jgi:hypothetical protein
MGLLSWGSGDSHEACSCRLPEAPVGVPGSAPWALRCAARRMRPVGDGAQRPEPGACRAQAAFMRVAASIGRAVMTDSKRPTRNASRNRLPHPRDAPIAHAALRPASTARPWLGHAYREPPTLQALPFRPARRRRTVRTEAGGGRFAPPERALSVCLSAARSSCNRPLPSCGQAASDPGRIHRASRCIGSPPRCVSGSPARSAASSAVRSCPSCTAATNRYRSKARLPRSAREA